MKAALTGGKALVIHSSSTTRVPLRGRGPSLLHTLVAGTYPEGEVENDNRADERQAAQSAHDNEVEQRHGHDNIPGLVRGNLFETCERKDDEESSAGSWERMHEMECVPEPAHSDQSLPHTSLFLRGIATGQTRRFHTTTVFPDAVARW
jgi:hypothetical protein